MNEIQQLRNFDVDNDGHAASLEAAHAITEFSPPIVPPMGVVEQGASHTEPRESLQHPDHEPESLPRTMKMGTEDALNSDENRRDTEVADKHAEFSKAEEKENIGRERDASEGGDLPPGGTGKPPTGGGGKDRVGVRDGDFPEPEGKGDDSNDDKVLVSDEVLDYRLRLAGDELLKYVHGKADTAQPLLRMMETLDPAATEADGIDAETQSDVNQLMGVARTVLDAQELGHGGNKTFSGSVVGHDVPRHFVVETWQKDEGSSGIQIKMFNNNEKDGDKGPTSAYKIFLPSDRNSEFIDSTVIRPEGHDDDPTTWTTDRPIVLKTTFDSMDPAKLTREILLKRLDDPALARVFDALEWEASIIRMDELYDDLPDSLEEKRISSRRSVESPNHLFIELDLSHNPTEWTAAIECLKEINRMQPIFVGRVENPDGHDPIVAIEAWQEQNFRAMQAIIGATEQDASVNEIIDFKSKLGFSGPTRLIEFNYKDDLPANAPPTLRSVQRLMLKREIFGKFMPILNSGFVSPEACPDAEVVEETKVHELIGHGTEDNVIEYIRDPDGVIYFWYRPSLSLPPATAEARASLLAANFMSIIRDRGNGSLYSYNINTRDNGELRCYVHDKYIHPNGKTIYATDAATSLDLLGLLGSDVMDAIIDGNGAYIESVIRKLPISGIYERVTEWSRDGNFDDIQIAVCDFILSKMGRTLSRPVLVQAACDNTESVIRRRLEQPSSD